MASDNVTDLVIQISHHRAQVEETIEGVAFMGSGPVKDALKVMLPGLLEQAKLMERLAGLSLRQGDDNG